MSNPRSLSFQRQCIEHLLALHGNGDDTIVDGAKQAALTIGWLERQAELLKMFDALRRERPELFRAMMNIAEVFPGARIEDVR